MFVAARGDVLGLSVLLKGLTVWSVRRMCWGMNVLLKDGSILRRYVVMAPFTQTHAARRGTTTLSATVRVDHAEGAGS